MKISGLSKDPAALVAQNGGVMRFVLKLGTLAMLASAAGAPVEACGDKFLALGRGLSFNQAYRSLHPGAIFIYTSAKEAGESTRRISKGLAGAGHAVSAGGSAALAQILREARTDIILAGEADAPALTALVAAAAATPTIIYIRAEKTGIQVVVPLGSGAVSTVKLTDARRFLTVIEDTIKARRAGIKGRRV